MGSRAPFRRTPSSEDVASAARARLELLNRELASAGLTPQPPPNESLLPSARFGIAADPPSRPARERPGQPSQRAALALVEGGGAPVPEPGRHARRRTHWSPTGSLADRLPATLQGRVGLGPAHVALVAVLVALGLAVAAVAVLRSGSGGDAVPSAAARASERSAVDDTGTPLVSAVPATPAASPAAAAGAGAGAVLVDVAGKVLRPGVVTLPAGSRVGDALRKAGGARPGVSLTSLNLARVLVDGEQILVGVPGPAGVAPSAASSAGGTAAGSLVNLNTATAEQLDTLPGVGPVTAKKILDWRAQHGAFSSVDELLEVDGIGEKTLADLAPLLTL